MRPEREAFPRSLPARVLLTLGGSLIALGGPALADGPKGGVVVQGKAVIQSREGRSTIRQSTNRAVIDWDGFDVGRDHTVDFDQPNRSSATLNRVDSARRSVIAGAIRAPGTVVIQNNAGVIFTGSARIDTGGLVATTQSVDLGRFVADGGLSIGGGEIAGARVVNEGQITIGGAGLAALVGGDVENAGAIVARRGTVALASGARTTVDFTGDGLVSFATSGDVEGGSRVRNGGLIEASDGRVILTAGSASRTLDAAINTDGVIRATSGTGAGGRVELTGRGDGAVRIAGAIDVSGRTRGGATTATGARIEIASAARIDARGGDGGAVRLGGDRFGTGPLRRADHLDMATGARVRADGAAGRGGEVVLWSDGATRIDGAVSATGAAGGGFVETSGAAALALGGSASVRVGAGGTWRIDPRDIVIGPGGVNSGLIVAALNLGGDVTVVTTDPGATAPGDITVNAPLNWAGAGKLTLDADRSITVNANVRASNRGDLTMLARTGDISVTSAAATNVIVSTNFGDLALRAPLGSILLERVNPLAASNVQVYSQAGTLDLDAGREVRLEGGDWAGQWVRLGTVGSSADVTVTAPRVTIEGGSTNNTFAEVVAGANGSLSIDADHIEVASGVRLAPFDPEPGPGRIQAMGAAPLALRAETQTWNGPVSAGNGASNGGDVYVSGAVAAGFQPQFSLAAGRSFRLAERTPDGLASSYASPRPFVVETSGTGAIEIEATVSAFQITLESAERVGLGPAGLLTATGPDDALVVAAGRQFRNDATAGAAALSVPDPDGRWLLYVDTFAGLGPAPIPGAFDLYGRSYDAVPPVFLGYASNRIVYAEVPTLTLTADTLSKVYGTTAAPGYSVLGLRPGDSLATALDAGPTVASAGSPAAAGVAGSPYATTVAAAASAQGYALDLVDGAISVTPAALTVTADPKTRSYGAAGPTLTASYSGFVLGQDATDLGGTLALATSATQASDVGTYAITAAGLTSGNYAITYAAGALAITPAALAVTPTGTRTYGAASGQTAASYAGFVLGEDASDLGGALTFATPATQSSDVGSYALTASGLTSSNYAITYAAGTLAVTPAALTVAADDATRSYGAAGPTLTASYSGFVLGEDATDLGGALALATSATQASDVGTYAITAAGLTSGNYAITYASGTLAVTPTALTVAADPKTRSYGAAGPSLTASYAGFVLGEDASDLGGSLSLATSATQASDVGTYAITAAGLTSGNYAITYASGTLAVTPTALTVTADPKTRSYGAAGPALTASYAGFVLGQDASDLGGALTFATPATQSSDVGTYALTASGLTSGNYAITYASGTLAVTPAALTVAADDATRSYGAAGPALTASYSGFVLGQDATDLGSALTFATPATQASDVGTYAITAAGLTSANYAITYAAGTLAITPAALAVTPTGTRTYGAASGQTSASYAGFVLGQDASDLGGTLTFATPATQGSDVGTYALTASGLTSGNYAITYASGTLAVTPAALTVAANDATRSYGAAGPALTASYAGFVLGEDASDLGGSLSLATSATQASDVGTYAITVAGLTSGNYAITYAAGTLAVTPAALAVTPTGTRTYGAASGQTSASYAGFVLGEDASDLGGTLTFATPATQSSDVGTYALTASGLTSGNYAITYASGTLAVTPAALTVTADDATRSYGATGPALTASYSGFVLGQDASDLGGTLTFGTPATQSSDVGTYALTAAGLTSGNYAISYAGGALAITPAALAVTPTGTRTYGAASGQTSASYAGFVLGEDASDLGGALAFATPATQSSDVGTYALTASGLTSGNYAITYASGTLAVTPAALTVTADDATRSYGATGPALTASYSGFVLGQDATDLGGALAFATTATQSSDVGTYALTASGLTSGNYAITYASGTLAVTPAALTVAADDATRSYGAAGPTLTASYSGFVLGQDATDLGGTLALATTATQASDVGTYAITAAGLTSGNYAISYAGGALAITPAALAVTPTGTRTYGAASGQTAASYAGFVLGQDASDLGGALTFATPATQSSDVGSYALTASGLTSGNYAITYASGTLAVTPAALTVAANDATRSYGAAGPALTASYSGFVLGEDATDLGGALSLTTPATQASDVGTYAITAAGLTSGNYAITYASGTLAVTPASLTVTAEDATRTYGAAGPALTASYSGFVLGQDATDLGGALTFATPATQGSDVGTYAITAAGLTSGNYAISYAGGALAITPAALAVTPTGTRTYGAASGQTAASYAGFVLGEDASDLGGALAFATTATQSSDVGTYALTASGLTSGNYAITYAAGTLAITPAALTVAADDATRTYGATGPALTASYSGFVLGQDATDLGGTLALATTATQASDVGTYAITAAGLTSGNYAITYGRGVFVIAPADLAVTANDTSRGQGQTNPAFSAAFDGFVLGQDPGDLGGALTFDTTATPASAPGTYALTPGGLSSGNYAIRFVDGALTVTPGAAAPAIELVAGLDRTLDYVRGAPPYTPGDSAFRTTTAEAPTSIDSTFELTYSLGVIPQLAPGGGADTAGFAPASGGSGETAGFAPASGGAGAAADAPAAIDCPPGPDGAADPNCAPPSSAESFWTTTFGEPAR